MSLGKGYPVYEYEQTVVLSGKNGAKISRTLTDSIGSQSSPLAINLRGHGNDVFLHWMANCKGHDKEKLFYSFPSGESMHDQMRADICHCLFASKQEATFLGKYTDLGSLIVIFDCGYFTVWKFSHFPASLILHEINFSYF